MSAVALHHHQDRFHPDASVVGIPQNNARIHMASVLIESAGHLRVKVITVGPLRCRFANDRRETRQAVVGDTGRFIICRGNFGAGIDLRRDFGFRFHRGHHRIGFHRNSSGKARPFADQSKTRGGGLVPGAAPIDALHCCNCGIGRSDEIVRVLQSR